MSTVKQALTQAVKDYRVKEQELAARIDRDQRELTSVRKWLQEVSDAQRVLEREIPHHFNTAVPQSFLYAPAQTAKED